MANKKITELIELPQITGDDLAVVVDMTTLTTRKTRMATLKDYFQSSSSAVQQTTETVTITLQHLSDKSFTLTNTPISSYNIVIHPRGGCLQFLNHDFTILGSSVTWDGYGLDGLLEAGDILQVSYYY